MQCSSIYTASVYIKALKFVPTLLSSGVFFATGSHSHLHQGVGVAMPLNHMFHNTSEVFVIQQSSQVISTTGVQGKICNSALKPLMFASVNWPVMSYVNVLIY